MDELEQRLTSYGEQWRAAQPPVDAPLAHPVHARRGWRPMLVAAAALVVVGAGVIVATHDPSSGTRTNVTLADDPSSVPLDKCAGQDARPAPEPTHDGRLPADFHPVSAVDCWTTAEPIPNEGTWLVLQERTTNDAAALADFATALRLPDQPPPDGQACDLVLVVGPNVLLTDAAGRERRPSAPTGYCGKPRQEVMESYQRLTATMTVVASKRIEQIESPEAQRSGCPDVWKDIVAVEPVGASSPWTPAAVQRDCTYRVSDVEQYVARRTDGGPVNAADAARLGDLLTGLPAPTPCTAKHTKLGVLHFADGTYAHVELDGCYRVLSDRGGWHQGNAELAQAMVEIASHWESAPPVATPTAGPPKPAGARPSTARPCTADELAVTTTEQEGAAGTLYFSLGVKSAAKDACSVGGRYGVRMYDQSNAEVPVTTTWQPSEDGRSVVLPGEQATTGLGWSDWCGRELHISAVEIDWAGGGTTRFTRPEGWGPAGCMSDPARHDTAMRVSLREFRAAS